MDNIKNFEDFLDRMQGLLDSAKKQGHIIVRVEDLENTFPELAESEDEKIRKAIHIYLDWLDGRKDYAPKGKYTIKDMISWLKKHGEPVEINPTEFDTRLQALIGKFDSLPKEELIGSLSFWLNVVQNDGTYKADEKKGEQKSAKWSEEDEERIKNILSVLGVQVCWNVATGKKGNPYQKEIDWLKSLKPQNHWKPTEAQLASLTIACDRNDRIGFDLTQLLKELKKL